MKISSKFPAYTEYDPLVPVWCVTPNEGRTIHRFFDTSPFSPSQRYMAVLRLPQEERPPNPGEEAEVVLIDLEEGTERVVAITRGWEAQLGANINWGATDNELYFNDVDTTTWDAFCVKLNPHTGESMRLKGTIYRISPDGKHIISACAKRMRRTQRGYGVVIPDELVERNHGFRHDDGLYITDTQTGECKLLISINDVFEKLIPQMDTGEYVKGECHGFHCKYNPQGDRLIFTLRMFKTDKPQPWQMIHDNLDFLVVTMKPDGTDVRNAVGPEFWRKRGHHINWHPNGRQLTMNLGIEGDGKLYFVQVDYDGKNMRKMHDTIPGSGHPTLHVNEQHILTDTYENEPTAFGDGTVPLRFIDLKEGTEKTIVRVNVTNPARANFSDLRVDPHPAWAPDNKHIAFNGYVGGTRRVFVADLSGLL